MKKKRYILPITEIINVEAESPLVAGSRTLDQDNPNWLQDKSGQTETPSNSGSDTPATGGDMSVDPGGDIGAKVNPWGRWQTSW